MKLEIINVVFSLAFTGLNAGKCPDSFVEHDRKCFKVSTDRLSWHEARFECLSLDGNYDLAIIDNLELFEFMKKYTNHWIGLYSRVGKRDFMWVDGTIVEFGKTGKQKPWGSLEPSDLGAHEDCVHTMQGGLWNDYYCGARFNYICGPASQEWCEFISEYECNDEYVKIHCPKTCSEHGRTVFGRVLGNHVYFQMEWKNGNLTCKADGKEFAGKPSYHKTYAQCPRWPKDSRNHTITLELNGKTVSTTEEEAIDEGTITNHVPVTSECEGNKRTKLDIGFVMDVSGSISKDDWKKEKNDCKTNCRFNIVWN